MKFPKISFEKNNLEYFGENPGFLSKYTIRPDSRDLQPILILSLSEVRNWS